LRLAAARQLGERVERDGGVALIVHLIGDGEQKILIQRNGARHHQPAPILPAQPRRILRRQSALAHNLPQAGLIGQRQFLPRRADPAKLRVPEIARALRHQELHWRRVRLQRGGIVQQAQIVQTRAAQIERADQLVGANLKPRRGIAQRERRGGRLRQAALSRCVGRCERRCGRSWHR